MFVFLPIVLGLYYSPLCKNIKIKNGLLLVASLGFYAYGEPMFVFVMLLSIIMNYIFGLMVAERKSKGILAVAVIMNLSILFIYKYLGFSVGILNGLGLSIKNPGLVLPIGISFFTFQAMSYVIDVYRGEAKVQKNIFYVALYISFFPQLIAGPIVRYVDIEKEIGERETSKEDFGSGVIRFIYGLAKKVVFANTFAMLADICFNMDTNVLSSASAWLGALAYTLQIYFDFSGYSDMAIGLGKLFGFHFLENFNYPYLATSISDFWRRWHISLSRWFRDYVYIPLGGNRVSKGRMLFNMFVVWLLTGLWHGANFTFILWGLWYFIFLMLEKLWKVDELLGVFSRMYTLFVVIISWVIFRSVDVSGALTYLGIMFGRGYALCDARAMLYLSSFAPILVLGIFVALHGQSLLVKWLNEKAWASYLYDVFMLVLVIITFAYLIKGTYNPFIYFNF